MDDVIVSALAGESVVYSNVVATVTTSCLVVRERDRGATVVISLDQITGFKKVKTTYPQLLVFSVGMLTLAAASYASKQGLETVIPMALVALMLALGYLGARRAALLVLVGNDGIETLKASFGEVESVVRQLRRVRDVAFLSN
jgi:hypothetical protein